MTISPKSTPLPSPDRQTVADDLRLLTPEEAECLRQMGKCLAARAMDRLITGDHSLCGLLECGPSIGISPFLLRG